MALSAWVGNCGAKITWGNLARGTLMNLAFGYAAEGFGMWLEEAGEGFNPCELCFAAGTPVHTDHGEVPIERIKVGDKVWARDEKTEATELRTVTAVAPQHRDALVVLHIEGEKNALRATPVHPFYARRNATEAAHWIDAGDLVAGEQISQFQKIGWYARRENVITLLALERG